MHFVSLPKPLQSGWQLLKRLATVKPPQPHITIGLDIGSSAVKVVALGPRTGSGARPLVGQHVATLGDGPDSQMASVIREAVSRVAPTVKSVNVSVSGQLVIMRVVEMPALAPQELAAALPFEAQRYVPFNIQDVVLDGAMLGSSHEGKLHVLIVACKRDGLEQRVGLVKEAGLEPVVIDVDALALANAWMERADEQNSQGTWAVMNVGAQWTNVVILKGGHPFLVRDIPWGAVKLTRHIAEQMHHPEAQIAAQLTQETALPAELADAATQACESLTTDLQLSFDFFENSFGTTPERLVVSGGLSRCQGFMDALTHHLAQPLLSWRPRENLTNQFAVAYGLALRTDVA